MNDGSKYSMYHGKDYHKLRRSSLQQPWSCLRAQNNIYQHCKGKLLFLQRSVRKVYHFNLVTGSNFGLNHFLFNVNEQRDFKTDLNCINFH